MKKVLKSFCLVLLTIFALTFCACKQNVFNATYVMDASLPLFLSVKKTNNINAVKDELQELVTEFENNFDTKNKVSTISKINLAKAGERVEVNADFAMLFNLSKSYNSEFSDFNPSIYPIIELWGLDNFTAHPAGSELSALPTPEQIESLLGFCSMNNFSLTGESGKFYITKVYTECKLDFGAIAKGYFSQIIAEFLTERGVKNNSINYAGNIYYCVTKQSYVPSIKIKNAVKNKLVEVDISLKKAAVVTSGNYERYYTYNGQIISHILTGEGRQGANELSSVSVINEDGVKCDVLATVACLKTKTDAISFLNEQNVLYLIVDSEGNETKNF